MLAPSHEFGVRRTVWGTGGPEFKSRRSDQQPLCSSSDFASAESVAANRKENIAAQNSRKRRAKSRTESRTVREAFLAATAPDHEWSQDAIDDDLGEPFICPVTQQPCMTEQDEFCEDYGCARKAGIDVDGITP